MKWYRKAAEQGNAEAQSKLAGMYANGQGALQDYQAAMKWYRKAAEQGNAEALANLGVMYFNGMGIPQDIIRGHMWFKVAAETISDDNMVKAPSIQYRDLSASQMTPEQINKAQEMARRCQDTKFKECE